MATASERATLECRQDRLCLNITTVDYNRRDPVFWIEAMSALLKYRHKQRRVPRYYSELVKLHDHLLATLDDSYIPAIPPCPIPRYDKQGNLLARSWWLQLSTTRAKDGHLSSEEGPEAMIQRWLDRVASHPRAQESEALREFIESDTGFRPSRTRKQKHKSAAGIQKHELDEDFWQLRDQIDHTHRYLQRITVPVHTNHPWSDMASAWVSYGGMERHPGLFIVHKYMAKSCHMIDDIEKLQDVAARETLALEIEYQTRNAETAQDIMAQRLDALVDYFAARKRTESRLRHVERLRASSNIDRSQASDAIADLDYSRKTEQQTLERYERIDSHYEADLDQRYKVDMAKDLNSAIRDYARSQLLFEKQKLEVWENTLANIRQQA
ncbi:hypothetical protein BCR43DRAFT_367165 [Syncephalastrum racemosum]|uniref:PX domain-containing protein n=1 Tax=Syncephalastrum racemosum TaxID=13706 RepID=A0A1X2H5A8_SYNRA|nr:hypothetical protein BCR43DRAFT_367165 [Syncephalastrum racemosum]